MKAIYLTKYGSADQAFQMIETDIPTPKENEVLIKVHYSGLNFADVIARRGMYPDAPKNPAILGYDVSGEIAGVGSAVKEFKIGQQVAAMTRFGGYAEYAVTDQSGVTIIPADFDQASATVLTTQGCTAYYCAVDCFTLHKGDHVLIHAAGGGVGSLLVQIAKHYGCIVFGTASGEKQDYIKSIGVDYPIDYTRDDFYTIIKNSGNKLDAIFDSLGGTAFSKGMNLLGPGGKMVSFGAAEQLESRTNKLKLLSMLWGFGLYSPISLLMQSKSIITVNMLRIADFRQNVLRDVLRSVVELASEGVIKPHVSKVFSASEIANAHEYLESRQSIGKVVLKW